MRTDANPTIIKYTYTDKGNHGDSGSSFYFSFWGQSYEEMGVNAIAGGEESWNKFKP